MIFLVLGHVSSVWWQQRLREGICARVIDGDTVVAKIDGESYKLRLAYIDAPELDQLAFDGRRIGSDSKVFLEQRVLNQKIHVRLLEKDRYGRHIAQIFYAGEDMNQKMLESGHALVYRFYQFSSRKQKVVYLSSQLAAKRARLGVWSTFAFHDPYRYRRLKRSLKKSTKRP